MSGQDKKLASAMIKDFKSERPAILGDVKKQAVASLRVIAICYSMEASVKQLDICREFVEEAIGARLDRFQTHLLFFVASPHLRRG